MERRQAFLIDPYRGEIEGARVLDLASHDGRWPYAFAEAGAREVIGIEGRQDLIDEFATFPESAIKARVSLRQGDINDAVPEMVAAGERFDVIGVLGIFYHITTHYLLLSQIRALEPRLILIDSEFMNHDNAMIQLVQEDATRDMNTLPYYPGQTATVKGVPSRRAMDVMATSLGYSIEWIDWGKLHRRERTGVKDYYREGPMTRASCALRPV
ncbi:MAG: class I SAM-dependent methyltransferase [Pseudomonadota bacterium]